MKALVIWANGSEEIEAITPVDLLRRAEINVTVAGLDSLEITGARGTILKADVLYSDYKDADFDLLVLPGGHSGSVNLSKNKDLQKQIKLFADNSNKRIGAICAAPALVLNPTGVLTGKKATCYPGYEKKFNDQVLFQSDQVVTDGNITTSRGPGTAFDFSLELIRLIAGPEKSQEIAQSTMYRYSQAH